MRTGCSAEWNTGARAQPYSHDALSRGEKATLARSGRTFCDRGYLLLVRVLLEAADDLPLGGCEIIDKCWHEVDVFGM